MKVMFVGRLAADVEKFDTKTGGTLLRFSVPDEIGYGDNEKTQWIKCVIVGKRAESGVAQYLVKGQWVHVTGELSLNTYTNREGVEKSNLSVFVNNLDILWQSKVDQSTEASEQPKQEEQPDLSEEQHLSDEIPF